MSENVPQKVDWELIRGILKKVRRALRDVKQRFRRVTDADSFRTPRGRERRDSICMLFQATGESFKQIDDKTNKTFLSRYSEIEWKKVIGFRNVLAHDYFSINETLLFNHCQTYLPLLLATVNRMIEDLEKFTEPQS